MKKLIGTCIFSALIFNYTSAQHYIIFFAYPAGNGSMAGHAYISFITKDYSKQQTILDGKWGFHPVEQSYKAIYAEESKVEDERKTLSEYDFVVEIKDDKVYENCKKVKEIWESKKYGLIPNQTCVGFVKDVAIRIPGLTVPTSFMDRFPKDFLVDLRKVNSKIDAESRKSLSKIDDLSTNPVEVEDFKLFVQKFSKEKAFQLSRTKFPIRWTEITEYNSTRNKVYQHTYTKTDWKHIDLTIPTKKYPFIDEIYPPSREYPTRDVVEMYVCEGCGSGLQYIFVLQAGKWFLKEVHWFFV